MSSSPSGGDASGNGAFSATGLKWYHQKDEQVAELLSRAERQSEWSRHLEKEVELLGQTVGLMLSAIERIIELDAVVKYSSEGKQIERYIASARQIWIRSRGEGVRE